MSSLVLRKSFLVLLLLAIIVTSGFLSLRLLKIRKEKHKTSENVPPSEELPPIGGVPSKRERRIDAIYNMTIVTPHIPWAKPYAYGSINAYIIPSVRDGRIVVELAERLSLNYTTVTIDKDWDVNKWSIGVGDNYGKRCDKNDFSLLYNYLKEDMDSNIKFDVIIMYCINGWNQLPKEVRDAIKKRVAEGTGLVIIHPFTGERNEGKNRASDLWEISPLVYCLSDWVDPSDGYPRINWKALAQDNWIIARDHYITRNVVLTGMPFDHMYFYKYELANDAEALIVSSKGNYPILAVKNYGKGRVVAFAYREIGIIPYVDKNVQYEIPWEHFYSLLIRAIIWAAKREPKIYISKIVAPQGTIEPNQLQANKIKLVIVNQEDSERVLIINYTYRNWLYQLKANGTLRVKVSKGENVVEVEIPSNLDYGLNYLDVILTDPNGRHYDWGSCVINVAKGAYIFNVSLDKDLVKVGEKIKVTTTLVPIRKGVYTVVAKVIDKFGRVTCIEKREVDLNDKMEITFTLNTKHVLTRSAIIQCSIFEGNHLNSLVRKQIIVLQNRTWNDYEVYMPWSTPYFALPWYSTWEEQVRKLGITIMDDPWGSFKYIAQVNVKGLGVYWYRRDAYLKQKEMYYKTKDKSYLIRRPCLNDPEYRNEVKEYVIKRVNDYMKYSPMAYFLGDECSLTCYGDAFDLCWSPYCLAKFRSWLKQVYGSLDKLNEEWNTNFKSWDEVIPMTTEEAQAHGDYAPWADHRTFMEITFTDIFRFIKEIIMNLDPQAIVGITGTQAPYPHNGCDWWRLDKVLDWLEIYSVGGQEELHRSFSNSTIICGATGYGAYGPKLKDQIWRRLFHNHRGALVFWVYSEIDPDLKFNPSGRDLSEVFNEIERGIGKAIMSAKREHDGIAIHYSMASAHGAWIQDGKITKDLGYSTWTSKEFKTFMNDRDGWNMLLEHLGFQYNYISTEQIENGILRSGEYRVLILPYSIALSPKEVEEIKNFVKNGGILIADAKIGLMDDHCKYIERLNWIPIRGALDDIFGIKRTNQTSREAGYIDIIKKSYDNFTAPIEGLPIFPVEPNIEPTTGIALAKGKEVPAIIINKYGKGVAVYLNFWIANYVELGSKIAKERVLLLMDSLFKWLNVRPKIELFNTDGSRYYGGEVVRYSSGSIEYVALFVNPDTNKPVKLIVDLGGTHHVYNVREKKYLGFTSNVTIVVDPGEPTILALLPYKVEDIEVKIVNKTLILGSVATLDAKIIVTNGTAKGHTLRFEVYGPDGKERLFYSKNVYLDDSDSAEFSIPFAFNDPKGEWTIKVIDIASGYTKVIKVNISS